LKNNNNLSLSDLSDSTIIRENESLLSLLLKDHTTGKNIKWGTNSYINHGYSFRDDQEIKIDLITGWYEGFIQPRVDKDIDIQLERQRNRAEVFTPSWVIKLQVDAALKDMEELPLADFIQTKWLEITCGEAPYMVNRYDMESGEVIPLKERSGFIDVKFRKLNEELESEEEWLKFAVEIYKASYGYEYQGDSLLLARENLILTFIDNYFYMFGSFPKEKTLLEITKIISLNVFQMDALMYEVPYSVGDSEELGTQLSLFEEVEIEENIKPKLAKLKHWDENKIITFKEITERNDSRMKFDVVIGNPPYQEEKKGTSAKPIYPSFMDSAYRIGEKAILITPARFLFNAGKTKKTWNEKMLEDEHLKVLYYEPYSPNVFQNTDIKGGITITYRDDDRILGPIEVFTAFKELEGILKKVNDSKPLSFSKMIFAPESYKLTDKFHEDFPNAYKKLSKGHKYSVTTNIFDKLSEIFHPDKPYNSSEYIQIYGRTNNKREYRWVKSVYISCPENFTNYKVFLPKSNGSGALGEVLSTPMIGQPMIGHTQTFLSIGDFKSKDEVSACLKYIKTKFTRTMLGILKVTQDNKKATWKYVPLQDFTNNSDIDWTTSINKIDKQLYKKYDLTQEEIDFIETNIKEME